MFVGDTEFEKTNLTLQDFLRSVNANLVYRNSYGPLAVSAGGCGLFTCEARHQRQSKTALIAFKIKKEPGLKPSAEIVDHMLLEIPLSQAQPLLFRNQPYYLEIDQKACKFNLYRLLHEKITTVCKGRPITGMSRTNTSFVALSYKLLNFAIDGQSQKLFQVWKGFRIPPQNRNAETEIVVVKYSLTF